MKRMKLIIRVVRWQENKSSNETNETNNSFSTLARKINHRMKKLKFV